MCIELTPPESVPQTEALSPPPPVRPVDKESAASMVKLDMDTINKLDAKVDQFIKDVLSMDWHSESFKEKLSNIHVLGNEEIRASVMVSSRLLDKPMHAMRRGLFDEKSDISQALISLRATVEDLDPAGYGDLLAPKKLFGLFPYGDKLRDYFHKYQSAQTHINKIILALYDGKEELQKDNAAIEEDKVNAWNLMQKMEQYVYIGKKLDSALEAEITQIEASDAEKARVLQEDMLYYLRQKVTDLLTQLAVTVQGYLAMDMIRKNNMELIKGIERATTTTISALRTAVIVSQALTRQKLVLEQINALNITTGDILEAASSPVKQQASEIQQQATSSTQEIEKLKNAFRKIHDTMDMVSKYKVKALDNMKQTADMLSGEVSKAEECADKIGVQQGVLVADTLMLASDDDIHG